MTFVETSTVELKRTFMPSLKKEIVAFANTDGGTVYLGVEDDGTVIGVEDPRGVADAVNNMIHDAVVPDLSMSPRLTWNGSTTSSWWWSRSIADPTGRIASQGRDCGRRACT